MKYANPLSQTLSVVDNGITYTKEIYIAPISLSGVTDESYPVYDSTATYNTGGYAIVDELKTIYRCTADSTTGIFPPSDPTKWVDYGFINSYRMLSKDEQIGSQTVGTDVIMELPFDQCDTLALINVYFTDVVIEQIDNNTGDVVIAKNVSGRDIACLSFGEYFYDEIRYKTRITIDGFEWLPSSTLKLTFSGDVKIGSVVVGCVQDLGVTLMGTELSFDDNSKIQTDEITNTRTVLRYGHIRKLNAKLSVATDNFDTISQKISEIIGKNILFVPTENDKFSEMTNIAYIEDCNIPVENAVVLQPSMTIIGVV